ncbi:MAG: alpha-2-macroglobulin family protein, partial [Thermonemataceae bacterium]|nr:alpha-2-macroglobulin family protein [Thermonemataceae bacterium]
EVKFEPLKQAFRLGEQVSVEGKAQAYSGANIDNAQVKYRVVRKAVFPYWWRWYGYYPESPEIEITNGTSQTDANGVFKVNFEAIPDLSLDKANEPIFYYTVYADVTDLNGETRSSETVVKIGYKALEISTNLMDIQQDNWQNKAFKIQTTNLMGEFEPAQGEIHIYKLKSPQKAFKQRLWQKPELSYLSKTDFEKMFPMEAYQNEDNKVFWEKEKSVFNLAFNTREKQEFEIKDLKKWQQGVYMVEMLTQDKFGQAVKNKMYFEVISEKSKNLPYPKNLSIKSLKNTHETNEKAEILLSASGKWNVLYEVVLGKDVLKTDWLKISNEQKISEISLQENYRGGLYVFAAAVAHNRLYNQQTFINVPYTNKDLEVIFETYRNKLQPGQQEEWKIRIKGKKADKVAAEMLATLYDASLDVFRENSWNFGIWQNNYYWSAWQSANGFGSKEFTLKAYYWNTSESAFYYTFDNLNWFGYHPSFYHYRRQRERGIYKKNASKPAMAGKLEEKEEMVAEVAVTDSIAADEESPKTESKTMLIADKDTRDEEKQGKKTQTENFDDVKIRKNFSETAFFYPDLRTNENGEIIIKFTIPEALTRWKMLGFVHTQDLAYKVSQNSLVTQKDLMLVPNQPRFFRENDEMIFAVKITSLVEKQELQGQAKLEFFDAISNKKINFTSADTQNFSIKSGQSQNLEWKIKIPDAVQAITYRVVAKAGNFSDGEEMTLPVLSNRMLVTETMPLPIRGKQEKNFKFEKLLNSGNSNTLKHQRFTLEFTSNPAWYAVQALPYMMEYPYECVEQTFSRYYANSIATHIANSNPKIKNVFDTWKNYQPDALLSNLEKNQELKSAILEETPWVLNAKDETQRKRQVALLFDLNRMANEQAAALEKVRKHQLSSGGFTWFLGFPEDRYMTQHIIAQMGHLDVMKVKSIREDSKTWNMLKDAIRYADRMIDDDYDRLKACVKRKQCKFEDNNLSYIQIQYLYARSYFKDIEMPNGSKEAFNYYLGQAKKYWLSYPLYTEGMLALALDRFGDKQTPAAMIKSFSEKALHSEEFGMYWKQERGWWWYQAPIETQALMIEVYDEVAKNQKAVEDLKVWLLKQKQTQDWKTTRATAEACFALLRRGADALASEQLVEVSIGGELVRPTEATETKVEAGTGYFKTAWTAEQIKPSFGEIKVSKKDEGVAWGAVYWQYFEQLDKITFAETPISIKKDLFLEKDSDKGKILVPITENNPIKVGDLVKVRVEIRVDRDMEYVHLKDMRAAGFEPTNVLSSYKYQDGLYYYENTKDMATNFFISYLPKGTYVFEYPLRASLKGNYSNGITTIQCMYAPEFTSHSAGIRVKIN